MTLYRKKPVIIEAHQYTGSIESANKLVRWAGLIVQENGMYGVPTLEGVMTVSIGDYIIKGVAGEFYPCKPEIFKETYVEA